VLEQLAAVAPRPARVVEMCLFASLTGDKVTDARDITRALVKTDWCFARALLQRKLRPGGRRRSRGRWRSRDPSLYGRVQ
jgi:hypothetical protein